jgi:hypothetical protein
MITLKVEPVFKSLHSEPAFKAIVDDMGLAGRAAPRSSLDAILGEQDHEKT